MSRREERQFGERRARRSKGYGVSLSQSREMRGTREPPSSCVGNESTVDDERNVFKTGPGGAGARGGRDYDDRQYDEPSPQRYDEPSPSRDHRSCLGSREACGDGLCIETASTCLASTDDYA